MSSHLFRSVYVAELNDLCEVEQQLLLELPLLAARASSPPLREAFEENYRQTQRHAEWLRRILSDLEERFRHPGTQVSRGLIDEAHVRDAGVDRGPALDARLISLAKRIEHFKIAACECARMWALASDDTGGAATLQQILDDEWRTNARLSALAAELTGAAPAPSIGDAPTSLMPGVWVTETTGFASVPPRADSDMHVDEPGPAPGPEERADDRTRRAG